MLNDLVAAYEFLTASFLGRLDGAFEDAFGVSHPGCRQLVDRHEFLQTVGVATTAEISLILVGDEFRQSVRGMDKLNAAQRGLHAKRALLQLMPKLEAIERRGERPKRITHPKDPIDRQDLRGIAAAAAQVLVDHGEAERVADQLVFEALIEAFRSLGLAPSGGTIGKKIKRWRYEFRGLVTNVRVVDGQLYKIDQGIPELITQRDVTTFWHVRTHFDSQFSSFEATASGKRAIIRHFLRDGATDYLLKLLIQ